MASTNITFRIDDGLKANLQTLLSDLGMDVTTYFTLAAKQAVREQGLPFIPTLNTGTYGAKAYRLAMENTKYNADGKPVISKDDEWRDETEWDDLYTDMKREIMNE